MGKRAWQTPELVVLTKGRPEEAVLQGCKVIEGFFSELGPDHRKCIKWFEGAWVGCEARTVT